MPPIAPVFRKRFCKLCEVCGMPEPTSPPPQYPRPRVGLLDPSAAASPCCPCDRPSGAPGAVVVGRRLFKQLDGFCTAGLARAECRVFKGSKLRVSHGSFTVPLSELISACCNSQSVLRGHMLQHHVPKLLQGFGLGIAVRRDSGPSCYACQAKLDMLLSAKMSLHHKVSIKLFCFVDDVPSILSGIHWPMRT